MGGSYPFVPGTHSKCWGQRGIGFQSPVPNTWTSLRTKGEVSKDRSSIIRIDENAFDSLVGSLGGGSTNLILGDLRSSYCGLLRREALHR
jgi:hypothetical protein